MVEVPGQECRHVAAAVAPVREARVLPVDNGVNDGEDGPDDAATDQGVQQTAEATPAQQVVFAHEVEEGRVHATR